PIHAPGVSGATRKAGRGSSHHARRRVRAPPDGQPADERTLLEPHQGVRAAVGRADAAEHLVQRKRAYRAQARRSARLLSPDSYGCAGDGAAHAGAPGELKISFFNRSYWPDQAATGQLLTELAEDLVGRHGCDVTVVAGRALHAAHNQRAPFLPIQRE